MAAIDVSVDTCGDAAGVMRDTILDLCGTTNSLDEIVPLAPLVLSGIQLLLQTDLRYKSSGKYNINAHQLEYALYPRHSQPAASSMPSPHTSVQNTLFDESQTEPESQIEPESETESESVTEPESNPDKEYDAIIENQLGLPQYQHGIESSPPPVDANANCDKLNNGGEFFFSKKGLRKLTFRLAKVTYSAQVRVSADEENDCGDGVNTDVVVLLGDKVRITSSLWYCLQKIIAEKDEDRSPCRRPIPF